MQVCKLLEFYCGGVVIVLTLVRTWMGNG